MSNKANEMTKMLENFYKSCKYSKFQNKYYDLLDSDLNDNIKNYLRILNTNFLFLINKKKALNEYEKINLPTENKYLQAYYFLEIVYLINKDELKLASDKLNTYHKHGSITKEDAYSLELYLSIYSNKEIKDIEKIFPLNNKVMYQNIFNAKLLMDYFFLKEDSKAVEYAKYLKKNKTDFTDTNLKAELVINTFKQ